MRQVAFRKLLLYVKGKAETKRICRGIQKEPLHPGRKQRLQIRRMRKAFREDYSMSKIQIFNNPNFGEIRTVEQAGEPWFVAKDIAVALGYATPRNAVYKHVSDEDRGSLVLETPGGKQPMTIVNESGLYSLILSSKLDTAKKFKRWVTSEVLPTIRKHGAYMTNQTIEQALQSPEFLIELATKLKNEQEQNRKLKAQNEELQPKALFADAVATSSSTILIGDFAKILQQNGYNTGQKRLFAQLRDEGYLIKRKGTDYNSPTQKAMEMGLFEIKEGVHIKPDGVVMATKTTKMTGKGQIYFINRYLNKNIKSLNELEMN